MKQMHRQKPSAIKISPATKTLEDRSIRIEKLFGELNWDMASINIHLENIRRIWAQVLGVSGPQWVILMATNDLDKGPGVSVGDVAVKLHVQSTFVTAQSKMLEQSGLLSRRASPVDARIVLMSLTEKARREIARLSVQRNTINEFIFADVSDTRLREVAETLALIKRRIEKAASQLELDKNQPDN